MCQDWCVSSVPALVCLLCARTAPREVEYPKQVVLPHSEHDLRTRLAREVLETLRISSRSWGKCLPEMLSGCHLV